MRYLLTLISLLFIITTPSYAKATGPIARWQTTEGIPVIFYQAMDIPMLDVSLAFKAGSAYDGPRFGLSTLTTRLLNQGNDGLDATALANLFAETGAQTSNENNRDMVVMHLKTLTEKNALKGAVSTFSRLVKKPDFPPDAFAREKQQQHMSIQHALESPDQVATQTFFQALYQAHPYAHPVHGNLNTLEAITREDVRRFHQTFFVAQNATLVLVGALDMKAAKAIAEQITQSIPQGKTAPDIPSARPLREAMDVNVPFPSSQTVLRLGQVGINHHSPLYFPLLVGNYTLGGGSLVSRLADELREKRGLTYGVSSQFIPMPRLGPFVIGLSTKSSQAETAEKLTRDTLTDFIKAGPSDAELKAAKQYLIGSFPLSIASNHSMAGILLKMAFYDLPDDYLETYRDNIASVDTQKIQQAFKKSIQPERLLQVMVGKV